MIAPSKPLVLTRPSLYYTIASTRFAQVAMLRIHYNLPQFKLAEFGGATSIVIFPAKIGNFFLFTEVLEF
ncbi:hypothetical protein T10_1671 [Trichinella papuae]|uniref:Uncharacterized protein n=1 Tax=Trichinella papuae TaxID=268474 RepID=A0A0V1N7Q7_9BILA|nr:hypothetical protein T10_1671 [Trichinella papuae]